MDKNNMKILYVVNTLLIKAYATGPKISLATVRTPRTRATRRSRSWCQRACAHPSAFFPFASSSTLDYYSALVPGLNYRTDTKCFRDSGHYIGIFSDCNLCCFVLGETKQKATPVPAARIGSYTPRVTPR